MINTNFTNAAGKRKKAMHAVFKNHDDVLLHIPKNNYHNKTCILFKDYNPAVLVLPPIHRFACSHCWYY